MKTASVILCCVLILSCRAPFEERLLSMDKWQVCQLFADYAFAGESKWLLVTREEIRRRGWDNDEDCRLVYATRMAALSRADVNKRVDWALAIGTAAVLKQ